MRTLLLNILDLNLMGWPAGLKFKRRNPSPKVCRTCKVVDDSVSLKSHPGAEALSWAARMRLKGVLSNGRVMGRGSEGGDHGTEWREGDEVRGWQVRWSNKGVRWVISGSQRRMECGQNWRERDWSVKHGRKVLVWERTSEHTLDQREEPRGEMVINLANAVTGSSICRSELGTTVRFTPAPLCSSLYLFPHCHNLQGMAYLSQ